MERQRVVRASMRDELWCPERRDGDMNRREALVEEVSWDPSRRNVLPWRRRLIPAPVGVHRVEDDVSALVDKLDLWKDGWPVAVENHEPDLDPDRVSDVDGRALDAVLNDAGTS